MNARERMLLIVLVTVLGGGGLAVGTYQWYWKPLQDLNKQIAEIRHKRDDAQDQWSQFEIDQRKLLLARTKSLPADPAEAAFEYMTVYLQPLLNRSRMTGVAVQKSQAVDMKFTPSIPGVKKVGHQMMTFTVTAKGNWGQLIDVMEQLQRTPYEHRVRSLTVERENNTPSTFKDPSPKLRFTFSIETLLVAKTRSKPGFPPGFDPSAVVIDSFAARQAGAPFALGMLGSAIHRPARRPSLWGHLQQEPLRRRHPL
jgi:hypothetical protein